MTTPMIRFEQVSKKFRRGERHDSLRDLLPSIGRRVSGRRRPAELDEQEFWAVKDVSFDVRRGEALGVIGPNGAGKSTVLKLLTRILKPTCGHLEVRGRVGALIEVAAGFHPDLTGRENVFLQGAIMGMRRAEIHRKLDAIVDFAGVGEFVDTAVKRYSSGMNARLGFAIAAHLDPDVLIIDEVLAVGDVRFQRKCFERMAEFQKAGVAIVFVSHDLDAIRRLCQQVLLLDGGRPRFMGPPIEAIGTYLSDGQSTAAGADGPDVEILGATLIDAWRKPVQEVAPGARLVLRVRYRSHRAAANLSCGFAVYRQPENACVFDSYTHALGMEPFAVAAGDEFEIDFQFRANLLKGLYDIVGHVYDIRAARHLQMLRRLVSLGVNEAFSHAGVAHLEVGCAPVHRSGTSAVRAS